MTYTPQELTIREPMSLAEESSHPGAHLDSAHVGHIRGGLGTILQHDVGPVNRAFERIHLEICGNDGRT